jgi:hypothetical protein
MDKKTSTWHPRHYQEIIIAELEKLSSLRMSFCVFCGKRESACHKLLPTAYVQEVLQRQKQAGVCEPVLELMYTMLAQQAHTCEALEECEEECAEASMKQKEGHEESEQQEAALYAEARQPSRNYSRACAASTGWIGAGLSSSRRSPCRICFGLRAR